MKEMDDLTIWIGGLRNRKNVYYIRVRREGFVLANKKNKFLVRFLLSIHVDMRRAQVAMGLESWKRSGLGNRRCTKLPIMVRSPSKRGSSQGHWDARLRSREEKHVRAYQGGRSPGLHVEGMLTATG